MNPVIGFYMRSSFHTLIEKPGEQYPFLRWDDLKQTILNPVQAVAVGDVDQKNEKLMQPAVLPSLYCEYDARRFVVQEDRGSFVALSVDADGSSVNELATAIWNVFGNITFMAFPSYSDGIKEPRSRALIPLAQEIPGRFYKYLSMALSQLLREQGIAADDVVKRRGQIMFYGMKGPVSSAQPIINESQILDISGHRINDVARELLISQPPEVKRTFAGKETGPAIRSFNRQVPTELVLAATCTQESDGKWTLPDQSSKGSLMVYDDGGWTSFSQTSKAGGSNGNQRFGDAYDLFKAFVLDNNDVRGMIIASACLYGYQLPPSQYWAPAYAEMIATEAYKYSQEFATIGERIWKGLTHINGHVSKLLPGGRAAVEAVEQILVEDNKAAIEEFHNAVDKGFTKYTVLGPLTGFAEEVAQWVEHNFMHYDQPELAKLAALTAIASFTGRKDSFEGAAPVFNCLALAITGSGKDTIRKFVNAIINKLEDIYYPHKEMNVFAPTAMSEGIFAYNREVSRRLSTTIILSESGLMKKSSAGDRSKVQGAVMQNITSGAYSKFTFTEQKDKLTDVYGVNHSIFEESTPAAFMEQLAKSNAHETGEAGRRLFYRIDVSRGNTQGHTYNPEIPQRIIDGFYRLADEALRGEEEAMRTTINDVPAPGTVKLPSELKRSFTADAQTQEHLAGIYETVRKARASNIENEASIRWNHENGRQSLIQNQLALLLARTDATVYGKQAVVEWRHMEAAERLVSASKATELANSADFEDPMDGLTYKVLEMAARMFSKPEPSKSYIGQWSMGTDAYECFRKHYLPWRMVTTSVPLSRLASGLVNGSYNKSKVWPDIQRLGVDKGFWDVETEGKKTYLMVNLGKLNAGS